MIAAGERLGPYEITALIGAGGMGEVYRARDTRLDRSVAIKVLPSAFSRDEQLRARFGREAKAISALTNPHICVLYDVGSHDGVDFLVMELLEGETLADMLSRGALRTAEVLRYGAQIASALAHAHAAGITHRDLKPSNIIITKSGAKVLDFGLAKFTNVAQTTAAVTQKPLTAEGTVIGTLQYMAPEQIEGTAQDERTDIFAFGAVLYEMITGRRAFDGKSRVSVIAAILENEPPRITTIQPLAPPALERLVRICLAKHPDERFQSARDIVLELQWIERERSDSSAHAAAPRRSRRLLTAWIIAAVALIAAAVAGTIAWKEHRAVRPRALRRLSLPIPSSAPLLSGPFTFAASPDGNSILYTTREKSQHLNLLRFDGTAPVPIAGTEGGAFGFFSPDSEWIVFSADQKLKKVQLRTGAVTTICNSPTLRAGVWAPDGTIVFTPVPAGPLMRVPAAGGNPVPLTRVETREKEKGHRAIDVLPDGDHILLAVLRDDGSTIEAVSLATGKRTRIMKGTRARYDGRGHLIVAIGSTIAAVGFDPKTLRVSGEPVPLVRDLNAFDPYALAPFDVTPDGALIYISRDDDERNLFAFDRSGVERAITNSTRKYEQSARYSPDGQSVVATDEDLNVWLCNVASSACSRFDAPGFNPIWSADGARVLYSCGPATKADLCMQLVDGSPENKVLLTNNTGQFDYYLPYALTPDGRTLVMGFFDITSGWQIAVADLNKRPLTPSPLIATKSYEGSLTLSPDGKWIAYESDAGGQNEIIVQRFPSLGRQWQISSEGGKRPVWSRRGDEIFYSHGTDLMAVAVKTQPEFSSAAPRKLFSLSRPIGFFDAASDGQHFLIVRSVNAGERFPHFNVVEGAIDALPTKR